MTYTTGGLDEFVTSGRGLHENLEANDLEAPPRDFNPESLRRMRFDFLVESQFVMSFDGKRINKLNDFRVWRGEMYWRGAAS